MPLPAITERAARTVEAELAKLDRAVTAHIVDGDRLPTVDQVMAPITAAVTRSTTAALRDVGATLTTRMVTDATQAVVTPIRDMVAKTLRAAAAARRKIRRPGRVRPADERDSQETIVAWRRRVGVAVAAKILVDSLSKRERSPRKVRETLRKVQVKPPAPTAAYGRMVVRTQTAIVRNETAADIVDAANQTAGPGVRWAMKIRDGLNGPTDHECERVDGRLATVDWLRRHTVAHPNCTRQATPYRMKPGDVITLSR